MILEFTPKEISEHNLANEKLELSKIVAFTHKINGIYSNNMTISIAYDNKHYENNDRYVAVELNKNQALYLRDFLNSFINEKEIDEDIDD